MSIDAEDFDQTVRIPVRFVGGHFIPQDGEAFPDFSEGALGDLIVPSVYVATSPRLHSFTIEVRDRVLPSGSDVFVLLSGAHTGHGAGVQTAISWCADGLNYCGSGVAVVLLEHLDILLRKGKRGRLANCRCRVPALDGKEFSSVNAAYTAISQAFERHRASFGGNVFRKVVCQPSYLSEGRLLDSLRVILEEAATRERRFEQAVANLMPELNVTDRRG